MDQDRTPSPATAAQDRRADVRAHVSQARAWTPDEATSRAAADFKDYHSPRLSQPGDADSMRHLREDMALRVRNSEPYRAELKRLDPVLTREVLAEPVSALGRQQPARQPEARQPDARLAEPEQNMIAALAGGRRMAEAELDAGQRATAKASIAANDRQADAKREVIDHMTPDELRRFVSAGADRAKADPILKEAAQREEKALATAPARSADPPLNERFNVSRWLLTTNYEFRDQPGKTAFSERFGKLHTTHNTPTAAIAMIDRAAERGWDAVRVQGDAEFKRQVWIAAEARGIKAVGYEPTKGDISAAAAERQRLERQTAGSRSARPSHLERQPAQPRDAAPAARAQGDEGADRAREKDRDKERSDDRASGRGFGAAAFMRALEQVMEREGVPQSQRPQIRQIAEHQLSALRAQGKTPRVRLVDREAPRRVPQQLPLYDIKRTSQERAR